MADKRTSERPALTPSLPSAEFLRWYWTLNELRHFSRELDLLSSGAKSQLTDRIAAKLDGVHYVEPVPFRGREESRQLSGVVTAESIIPRGQRCSQVVRAWMSEQTGRPFHFNAEMRSFFAATDGTSTMGDALEHWRRTRSVRPTSIGSQFEFNQFTRDWYLNNPGGEREALLEAWRKHRDSPIDLRKGV